MLDRIHFGTHGTECLWESSPYNNNLDRKLGDHTSSHCERGGVRLPSEASEYSLEIARQREIEVPTISTGGAGNKRGESSLIRAAFPEGSMLRKRSEPFSTKRVAKGETPP